MLLGASARAEESAPLRGDASFVRFLLDLGFAAEANGEIQRLMAIDGAAALGGDEMDAVGLALARAGRLQEAHALIVQAAERTEDPEAADERRLSSGVVLLKAKSYPQATQVFSRVEAFGATEAIRARADRLRCVGHVSARDGDAATACLSRLLAGDPLRLSTATGLLDDLAIRSERRAWVGGIMSAVLPGLGQATAGNVGDGALALLVNAGWIGGTYLMAASGAWLDSGLFGVGLGLRYYAGNVRNGFHAWKDRAERTRERAAERLMALAAGAAEAPAPQP